MKAYIVNLWGMMPEWIKGVSIAAAYIAGAWVALFAAMIFFISVGLAFDAVMPSGLAIR